MSLARFVFLLSAVAARGAHAVEDLRIDMQETDGIPTATAEAIVDAPPERVWAIIDRCADYKDNLVAILASRELSRSGNTRRCEVTVDTPFPMPNLTALTEATIAIVPGKSWRRTWVLVSGDYRVNNGGWTLTPAAGQRTHVIYTVTAQPTMAVPPFALRMGQKQAIPQLIEKLEAAARGKATRTPTPSGE